MSSIRTVLQNSRAGHRILRRGQGLARWPPGLTPLHLGISITVGQNSCFLVKQ